ncbi:putative 2-haloalkanoic acid dehalogenase [Aspergillus saccharolyticus JOP 1030-1]|uniref:HAD-like protein n=1 Tax=Aspergillus saccharolyticus JOP 1030-1 TaxID=1450539 RepID=A0A319AKJ7_9EURO|nr:HAD-like protein [Aspergillus saccharolyticus JOP 1030-1]PYH47142.1 HAD-like protein [Aspergillus saccharolyticus JOP 1030-1]
MTSKNVVFDVVGTCVSFSAFYDTIQQTLGPQLAAHNLTAQAFGFTWMTNAELQFTFLSISERYKPYKLVLTELFYQTLSMIGVANPTAFATAAQRDACVEGYSALELRPDTAACFATLRAAGFTVWCLTTGDTQRVRGYFLRAGVEMPLENFLSCDTAGVAKPALQAYRPALEALGYVEDSEERPWFAAAHLWDVTAATKVGFRGAYCTVYEGEPCYQVFEAGLDVTSESLVGMAEGIIKATQDHYKNFYSTSHKTPFNLRTYACIYAKRASCPANPSTSFRNDDALLAHRVVSVGYDSEDGIVKMISACEGKHFSVRLCKDYFYTSLITLETFTEVTETAFVVEEDRAIANQVPGQLYRWALRPSEAWMKQRLEQPAYAGD